MELSEIVLTLEKKINELCAEREASQSRERVYREALEEAVRCLTDERVGGYMKNMADKTSRGHWYLDKVMPAVLKIRAALTNNKLDEEKE